MNGIQTADLLPGREAQQLSFKDNVKLPLADVNVSLSVGFGDIEKKKNLSDRHTHLHTGRTGFVERPIV